MLRINVGASGPTALQIADRAVMTTGGGASGSRDPRRPVRATGAGDGLFGNQRMALVCSGPDFEEFRVGFFRGVPASLAFLCAAKVVVERIKAGIAPKVIQKNSCCRLWVERCRTTDESGVFFKGGAAYRGSFRLRCSSQA